MAKQFVLRFTSAEDGKRIDLTNSKGETVDVITTRELEEKILENLFLMAMNKQKEFDKAFECRDCLDQVRSLKGEESINFTAQDLKYLKEAFGDSAEKRPSIWLDECYNLFKQINSPVEAEMPQPEQDE